MFAIIRGKITLIISYLSNFELIVCQLENQLGKEHKADQWELLFPQMHCYLCISIMHVHINTREKGLCVCMALHGYIIYTVFHGVHLMKS